MAGNPRRDAAQPHRRIGAPSQMDRIGWKNALIKRSAYCARKYIGVVQGISVWIRVQHFEQGVEVVCRLIDVKDTDGAVGAQTWPQVSECNPYGGEGVLALRRSIVCNDEGRIRWAQRHIANCLLQERYRQARTGGLNGRVP